MRGNIVPVEDHEEWTKIVADSDTGAYVMQGFMIHDKTNNARVTNRGAAVKVLKALARRKGWDERLVTMTSPLEAHIPLDPTAPRDKPARGRVVNVREEGMWWVIVPVDYLDQLDDPEGRLEFHVPLKKKKEERLVILWAFEAHKKRTGEPQPLEFDYTVEFAIKDRVLHTYNDHPGAEHAAKEFFRGSAP